MNRQAVTKIAFYRYTFLLVVILALISGCEVFESSAGKAVDGWAVLAEKDDYEESIGPDRLVDYIDIGRMRQALENSGWNPDQIHDLREFDREMLQAELEWLEANADENDIAILYVSAHGSYLRDEIRWSDFFAGEWAHIPSQRRLLVVDTSRAQNYSNDVDGDPSPYLSVASTASSEYSWVGLEEEGLPIIGSVFTHYFASALDDPGSDTDGDGLVSIQEAALAAEEGQRTYMHDVVLAEPEFVEMFHKMTWTVPEKDPGYPHVIMDDTIGGPLYLALDAYR